ncbi:hypothetical protein B0H34DRAFT_8144 [Crassisporium funariophilum]|nr:hypothetical protein B0H34DRAFT_8144 [Crassisporium funariophilum]
MGRSAEFSAEDQPSWLEFDDVTDYQRLEMFSTPTATSMERPNQNARFPLAPITKVLRTGSEGLLGDHGNGPVEVPAMDKPGLLGQRRTRKALITERSGRVWRKFTRFLVGMNISYAATQSPGDQTPSAACPDLEGNKAALVDFRRRQGLDILSGSIECKDHRPGSPSVATKTRAQIDKKHAAAIAVGDAVAGTVDSGSSRNWFTDYPRIDVDGREIPEPRRHSFGFDMKSFMRRRYTRGTASNFARSTSTRGDGRQDRIQRHSLAY